ncbi:MAG: protein translocase subunit SecD [Lentisphaeria bacterium]|nr:protein translocase subunit SecD [Lentisphaeria bacterium]
MGGKFLKLRTFVIAAIIAVFAFSIYPLAPRDFYETFQKALKVKDDAAAAELVADAKALQEARPDLNQAAALLEAADAKRVDLVPLVSGRNLAGNADVIAMVRKEASGSIRLGLDLNGGVEFILELIPDRELLAKFAEGGNAADREKMERQIGTEFNRYREQAIETLRKRLESQNIFESDITPFGSRSVSLKAPITSKDEKDKLLSLIRMSCKLNFRLVHPDSARLLADYDPATFMAPPGYEVLEENGRSRTRYLVARRPEMTGQSVSKAVPVRDQFGQIKIALEFNSKGAADFARVTAENLHRQLAIVLDDRLYCAPVIQSVIAGGNAEISGSFSNEEAQQIADALSAGSFPFQIKVTAVYDTAPSMGADNVRNGVYAGLLAAVLLTIFMCVYYFRAGAIACIALGANIVLILGAMAAFGATMTMPGIAGVILTLGMAVDANVLVFERIREELSGGKSLATAIDLGYEKAFSAVFDGNLTTLICALILMYLGSGPVKGFAVSLSIGIVSSMFTALCLTRLIFDYALKYRNWKTLRMCRVFSNPAFDFLGRRKVAFLVSGLLILGSLLVFEFRGAKMFGVDFTGGTRISYSYDEQVPVAELEKLLQPIDQNVRIGYKSNPAVRDNRKLEILIRDRNGSEESAAFSLNDRVTALLNEKFPQLKAADGQETTVGGLVGAETGKASIIAILVALLGMSIYISIRFELSFAAAGILALVHDVIIAVGIFVLMGRELSLPVVAAVLTIIGYSINDTIVIFDRIREDSKLMPEKPFREIINISINRTLSRTLLTSVTTFLVVAVMFCFGGIVINDFVLVMMLGIVIGTYSSIFIASPLAAMWHRRIGAAK